MRSSSAFTLLALVAMSLQSTYGQKGSITTCEKYGGGFTWQPVIDLPQTKKAGEALQWKDYFAVPLYRKGGWNHKQTFTFTIGYPAKIGDDINIFTERSKGQGDGQQFLITFYDKSDKKKPVAQFWSRPNVACTFKAEHTASFLGGFKVESRDYNGANGK